MGSDTLEIVAEIEARNTFGLRLLRSEDGKRSAELVFSRERIQLADLSFSDLTGRLVPSRPLQPEIPF